MKFLFQLVISDQCVWWNNCVAGPPEQLLSALGDATLLTDTGIVNFFKGKQRVYRKFSETSFERSNKVSPQRERRGGGIVLVFVSCMFVLFCLIRV